MCGRKNSERTPHQSEIGEELVQLSSKAADLWAIKTMEAINEGYQ